MFGRNQQGCQDQHCACGGDKGIRGRGEEVARSLRSGRIARRACIDISEIRRRAVSDLRSSRKEGGIPVRIISRWRGDALVRTAKQDNAREEYTRGWLLPNARWAGISADCDGEVRRGGDVIEGGEVEVEFQSWGRNRQKNEKPPTGQSVPQHRRVRWESSREMKAAQGKATPLL